jgi:hypothetical protein
MLQTNHLNKDRPVAQPHMRGCHCKVPVYCTVSIHLHRVKLSGTEAERPTLERGTSMMSVSERTTRVVSWSPKWFDVCT